MIGLPQFGILAQQLAHALELRFAGVIARGISPRRHFFSACADAADILLVRPSLSETAAPARRPGWVATAWGSEDHGSTHRQAAVNSAWTRRPLSCVPTASMAAEGIVGSARVICQYFVLIEVA